MLHSSRVIASLVVLTIMAGCAGAPERAPVPAEFTEHAAEDFDPVYMRKLFAHAYEAAKNGYDWRPAPPGFASN